MMRKQTTGIGRQKRYSKKFVITRRAIQRVRVTQFSGARWVARMLTHRAMTILFGILLASVLPATAQQTTQSQYSNGNGSASPSMVMLCASATASGRSAFCSEASYSLATAMTVGTVYSPGRAIHITVTAQGNISLALSGGGTLPLTLPIGDYTLPFSVTEVNSSGTTATAIFENLS
jgi:hypothetical protein